MIGGIYYNHLRHLKPDNSVEVNKPPKGWIDIFSPTEKGDDLEDSTPIVDVDNPFEPDATMTGYPVLEYCGIHFNRATKCVTKRDWEYEYHQKVSIRNYFLKIANYYLNIVKGNIQASLPSKFILEIDSIDRYTGEDLITASVTDTRYGPSPLGAFDVIFLRDRRGEYVFPRGFFQNGRSELFVYDKDLFTSFLKKAKPFVEPFTRGDDIFWNWVFPLKSPFLLRYFEPGTYEPTIGDDGTVDAFHTYFQKGSKMADLKYLDDSVLAELFYEHNIPTDGRDPQPASLEAFKEKYADILVDRFVPIKELIAKRTIFKHGYYDPTEIKYYEGYGDYLAIHRTNIEGFMPQNGLVNLANPKLFDFTLDGINKAYEYARNHLKNYTYTWFASSTLIGSDGLYSVEPYLANNVIASAASDPFGLATMSLSTLDVMFLHEEAKP